MILDDLHKVILERQQSPSPDSYVSSLFAQGKEKMLKKIGEESAEVIISAMGGDRGQIVYEMADLWFHCMVLLASEGLSHTDVMNELEKRFDKNKKRS